ncbi:hypothetical protein [Chitinophaga sp. sic0106]|uniref:hypothetical protein n=1 Tax=Chitinophaga sp. sic0106 TaxID=2854785 RepID=UPI001C457A0F|nr:hypothetical protein [Chitinophaga sp. sic0106]MBV7531861.1 hypothetical protein [Chitinophaga sp. sic0106]
MSVSLESKKRIVLVYWKNRPEQPFEVFSNLKNFCLSYPAYNYNTLNNYLSKEKIPFDNKEVRVERHYVITQPKIAAPSTKVERSIVPVVRKVLMKEADDAAHDLEYWLNQPPAQRLAAVTFIINQSLRKNSRIDKTAIQKRPLKS